MTHLMSGFFKNKLLIGIIGASLASLGLLTVSKLNVSQTASVVAASCYLQSEVDQINFKISTIDGEITKLENESGQLASTVSNNNGQIKIISTKISNLNSSLVGDYVIGEKKRVFDQLYTELNERKTIASTLDEYNNKQSLVSSSTSRLKALNTTQINLRNEIVKLNTQTQYKKAIDTKYDGLQKYQPGTTQYKYYYDTYNKLTASYAKTFSTNITKSYEELNAILKSKIDSYYKMNSDKSVISKDILKAKQDALALQKKYSLLLNNYKSKYGYNTANKTVPSVENLTARYNIASDDYHKIIEADQNIKDQIKGLDSEKTSLEESSRNAENRINSIVSEIDLARNNKSDLENARLNASANICPATEMMCSDGIDDDRDGYQDCDDSDCSADYACRTDIDNNIGVIDNTTNTTNIGAGSQEICDNGIDDDGDGSQDCYDPDCASQSICASTGSVDVGVVDTTLTNSETCDNGVDDDNDGLIDCDDTDCSTNASCADVTNISNSSSGEICDDGIDNNGDGTTDCDDTMCKNATSCQCNVVDDNGNVVGTCFDFGVSSAAVGSSGGNLDGGKSNSSSEPTVKNPSDCPQGTHAHKIGTVTVNGVKTVWYRCVAEQGSDHKEDRCGNGQIDSGEECEVGDQIENGQCVYCSIECNDGWTRQKKESWVPQIPILGVLIQKMIKDEWYCSQLAGLNDQGLNELDAQGN